MARQQQNQDDHQGDAAKQHVVDGQATEIAMRLHQVHASKAGKIDQSRPGDEQHDYPAHRRFQGPEEENSYRYRERNDQRERDQTKPKGGVHQRRIRTSADLGAITRGRRDSGGQEDAGGFVDHGHQSNRSTAGRAENLGDRDGERKAGALCRVVGEGEEGDSAPPGERSPGGYGVDTRVHVGGPSRQSTAATRRRKASSEGLEPRRRASAAPTASLIRSLWVVAKIAPPSRLRSSASCSSSRDNTFESAQSWPTACCHFDRRFSSVSKRPRIRAIALAKTPK